MMPRRDEWAAAIGMILGVVLGAALWLLAIALYVVLT